MVETMVMLFVLSVQGALMPEKSVLEMGYRAGCHLNHQGVWASDSPLGDEYGDLSPYGKPSCFTKER